VRIPLNYYQILGLPLQATAEQIEQAYQDRIRQKPHSDYSEETRHARQQWLNRAYHILSDPEKRSEYDANYLLTAYQLERQEAVSLPQLQTEDEPFSITQQTPVIEVETSKELLGALVILYELGEYQRVQQLAEWVLAHAHGFQASPHISLTIVSSKQKASLSPSQFRDIVLTLALSCWELGRELWRQEKYEAAGEAVARGHQVLIDWDLFPQIGKEMANELEKLFPYRIFELLSNRNVEEQAVPKALQYLERMFERRGGIDGQLADGSGLDVEEFLHFVQQIRDYLTAAEQENLFAKQVQRGSAVAMYLAACAAMARGFAYLDPNYMLKAQQWLQRLASRQTDVALEQAICALLLGKTETALHQIKQSQETEAIANIEAYGNQGEEDFDWLLGLCRYSEQWLASVLFPKFWDLTEHSPALKDYFASESVQQTLEQLESQQESEPAATATEPTTAAANSDFEAKPPAKVSPSSEVKPSKSNIARSKRRRKKTASRFKVLVGITGVGIGMLGLWVFGGLNWSQEGEPTIKGAPLSISINSPPVAIPSPDEPSLNRRLSQDRAKQIVQGWLNGKAQALGTDHETEPLQEILAPELFSDWQTVARRLEQNNAYREFNHDVNIEKIQYKPQDAKKATIVAQVREQSQYYQNGTLLEQQSYDSTLQVRYDVVRNHQTWQIEAIEAQKSD